MNVGSKVRLNLFFFHSLMILVIPLWQFFFNAPVPPSPYFFFLWTMVEKSLTVDKMIRRKITTKRCVLFVVDGESTNHLFLH